MSSSNYFAPQPENTYPKDFPNIPNSYFGNDESNMDEYDNIDCELLLEFFGGESTGPQRSGYDQNIGQNVLQNAGNIGNNIGNNPYKNQNVQYPNAETSASIEQQQHTINNNQQDSKQFDRVEIKKERTNIPVSKAKKQKLETETQNTPQNSQAHQAQWHSSSDAAPTQLNQVNQENHQEEVVHKSPGTPKTTTSKIIQLEASKDRRRERNKVLARKTRCKKKAEFETLRKQLLKLRTENDRLKELVKGTLPSPVTVETLLGCDVQLPEDVAKVVQAMISAIEAADPSLLALVNPAQRSFCVTNAIATDNPIVYASPGFMELTGYDMHGILGHNCRLLQGKDTDRNEVRKLRLAIEQGREEQVVIKNYRRDGSSYWSRVQIAPMRDGNGRVTLIVSVQYEVPGPTNGMFVTAISDDMCGSHISRDDTSNDGTSSGGGTSSEGSQSSSSRSCASFADDRSGSCNGSTSGGSGSSSSGYSSNDNRSTDGVSDQGDLN